MTFVYARFLSSTAATPTTAMTTIAAPIISKVSVLIPSPVGGIGDGEAVGAIVCVGDSVGNVVPVGVEVGVGVTTADAALTLTAVSALELQYDSDPSNTAVITYLPGFCGTHS